MRCPNCKEDLSPYESRCSHCHVDLSLLQSFLALKKEINRAERDTSETLGHLQNLQIRVLAFEKLVRGSISSVEIEPPSPPPLPPGNEIPSSSPPPSTPAPAPSAVLESASPVRPSPAQMKELFEVKLGQKWLLIVGVVIMILGVGYFLKYSFDQNWIGPAGRVAMAYLAGLGCLATGEYSRRRDFAPFGLSLIGGGIAILYFSTFAAFQIYHLVGQATSFGIMILITILAGVLSLFYDTKWLAVLGIVGGFLTPVILSTGRDNQTALMTYMVILNGGILAIAFFKRWELLNYLGAAFTWLLFTGWFVRYYQDPKFWRTTVFLNLFFLTYALAPFVYFFVRTSRERLTGFAVTIPNAFVAFLFSYLTIKAHTSLPAVSVVSLSYAGLYTAMAAYLYRRNREHRETFVILLAKATLFLVVTVPVLFSRHWITVFWAVQACTLLWAGRRLKSRRLYGGALVLLALTTLKFVFYDYHEVFRLRPGGFYFYKAYTLHLPGRLLTTGFVLASLWYFARRLVSSGKSFSLLNGRDGKIFHVAMIVFLFYALNVEVGAFFHEYAPRARFASFSVLWTLFAAALMVSGFLFKKPELRTASLVLFGVTILKVFFSDMENVSTPFRIVSFLVLGILLIGASYLYHRYRDLIIPEEKSSDAAEEEGTP